VTYDDPDNNYHRKEQIIVKGDQTDDVRMHLALLNPDLREFTFRFTFVGTNGDFNRMAPQTTSEVIVPIRP